MTKIEKEIEQHEVSNRLFILLVVALVGITAFWGFRSYEIWNVASGNNPREIYVDGTGSAYATPDIAYVSVGVDTQDKTSEAAVETNTGKMNKVMDALKELEIEEKDIKTTNYNLSPNYEWTQERGSYTDGYNVSQSVNITVRDLDNVTRVLQAATESGANVVGNIRFELEDPDTAKDDARQIAIERAKAKAETIAASTGLKLGKVLYYSEYQNNNYNSGKGGMMYAEDMARSSIAEPAINPGQEEVELTVSLTYRVY